MKRHEHLCTLGIPTRIGKQRFACLITKRTKEEEKQRQKVRPEILCLVILSLKGTQVKGNPGSGKERPEVTQIRTNYE